MLDLLLAIGMGDSNANGVLLIGLHTEESQLKYLQYYYFLQ